MDIATGAGLVAGVVVIVTLILMGGDFRMFYDVHAIIIIFGGSFAATLIRFPLAAMLHGLPLGIKFAFTLRSISTRELVDELGALPRWRASRVPLGSRKSHPRIRSFRRACASSP